MYFILKGADFSTANLGKITVVEGSVGTGGTTIDPNAKYTLTVTPTPSDATVVLTPEGGSAVTGTTIEVTRGTKVTIELSKTGYVSQTFTTTVYGDKTYPAQIFAESVKTYTLTINPNPASATVIIDGAERKTITVAENSSVSWSISASGYVSQSDVWLATENKTLNITLVADSSVTPTTYTFTINPTPSTATVTLTASGYTLSGNSITVANGTTVTWKVNADGYTGLSGTWTANGSNESKSVTLSAVVVDGSTTWYVDHTNQADSFTTSVNIAGRGWSHVPGTDAYNAYVGKPVNTIGFFTNKASLNVTISKVVEKGGEADMTEIATVTLTNPSGATKGFCSASFPTVTLADGECLAVYTQTDSDIQFYYQSSGGPTSDANGVADGNFYGRVPKVYGSGTAWTGYDSKLCLGMSVGYNSEVA